MNQSLTQQRIRIRYGKFGAMRFVGHLDVARTWERILRRARFPLEYSQGFNPRPRMQFAAALTVGVTSEWEYLDAWLTARLGDPLPGEWLKPLAATSPAGIRLYDLFEVPVRSAALPTLVHSAEYVIAPLSADLSSAGLAARAAGLLAQTQIERSSRDKMYDLRPLILGLDADGGGNLIARLKTGEKGNARPDELVDALGLGMDQVRLHRRRLILDDETPGQAEPPVP